MDFQFAHVIDYAIELIVNPAGITEDQIFGFVSHASLSAGAPLGSKEATG